MSFLDTKHKKKSATLTTIIAIIILLLIFNFGMRYFDPPKEYGISVNFGTSNVGSGNVQPTESLKPATQEAEIEPVEEAIEEVMEEVVEEQTEASTPSTEASEEVITQQNEEAIAIKKREAERKAKVDAENIKRENERKEAERIETEKKKKIEAQRQAEIEAKKLAEIEAEKKRQEEAAKKKKVDDLFGGIGKTDGKADGGEGDDNQAGDKGQTTGDPNASGYYGNGGSGSGGNYRLGNRKAVDMPKPTYDCNEEGRVFVSISVDNSGNVISAQPGVKGTTNSATCLLERAKEAALKTKFNSDPKAPSKQIGTIIYNFSLSN